MAGIIATLLEEFHDKLEAVKDSIPRKASFPDAPNLIKVAIGMRRAGKTYFALQKILKLLAQDVPLESILYINFEDDRLLPMDHKAMGALIDSFYTLYPENHDRLCYFFFDEVQNIEEWALVIRRFFDTKKLQIFLTGSSAKLLSKEIATSLRGRAIQTEIWPYSFIEFLNAHAIASPKRPFGKKSLDIMRQHLLDYFRCGGFPGVQELSSLVRTETLQGYVETVILRDIIERHKVENIALLRYFINFLMKNVASPFSFNKFYNDIKSQGFRVGKDTLYNYFDHLSDAYLFFAVPHFSDSVREMQTSLKKVYVIDDGLLQANTFAADSDWGQLFENLIYIDLRRQGNEVFYYKTKSGYEVDFIAKKEGKLQMFQVAWETQDSETLAREMRALNEAEQELQIRGKIVDFASYLEKGLP